MEKAFNILLLCAVIAGVNCLEKEITVNIEPGKQDCFYEKVKGGDVIDIDYQVIDGGHGDLDITFHLVDPNGRILKADYKKSENNYRVETTVTGDYRFCFDNTYSLYNAKTVFFELVVEGESGNDWGDDNMENYEGLKQEAVYELTVSEIQEVVTRVRSSINKARLIQELLKSTEARDRNMAEENYFKVNSFSIFQIAVMISVGFIQVVMVKSLFDDSSKVHKIWKGFTS